jgi:toxin ParE1/3/4
VRAKWSLRARSDLLEIARFIAADDPAAARRWVALLRRRADEVASLPRSGRRVPEFASDSVREIVVGNYRIVYQIAGKGIAVLTVFEGHRLLRR